MCARRRSRRHPPIDSMQPEFGAALPRSGAEAGTTTPDCFAPSRRRHAPARGSRSATPTASHLEQRSTTKSPPLGPPTRTVHCIGHTLRLFTKPRLHPAPEGRQSPREMVTKEWQRSKRSKPPCTLPRGRSGPTSTTLLHQHGGHATSSSDHACGDQRRNRQPRSEAQKRGRVGSWQERTVQAGRRAHRQSEDTASESTPVASNRPVVRDRAPPVARAAGLATKNSLHCCSA
jgi:hypothetical protein